jgi:hypothetical protein
MARQRPIDSPSRHARAQSRAEQHPLIQSYEPGENWWWCFVDDLGLTVDDAPSFAHS